MHSTKTFVLRLSLLAGLVLALQISLNAQVRAPSPPPITAETRGREADDQAPTALDYELKAKREIKYAEKEHQENLTRARAVSDIGSEIAAAFKQNQALRPDDMKKLEKLEKLTKKIRNEAGASDDDFVLEKKPGSLAEAIDSIAQVSASLGERVLKTPRRVVSTAIIEDSNVLLELIRMTRTFVRK